MGNMFFRIAAHAAALSAAAALVFYAPVDSAAAEKARKTDDRGHVLVSGWKEYGKMKEADLPDKEAAVLEEIISTAEKKHIPWDFYDAWREYRDVVVSRDWKQRASVDSAMAESVRRFDEPVVTYNHMLCRRPVAGPDTMAAFARKNSRRLQSARNPMFYGSGNTVYSNYISKLPSSVRENIANDYEYVLWSAVFLSRAFAGSELWNLLSACISDSYPGGAYLEYLGILASVSRGERKEAMRAYMDRHEGRAVSLFAAQTILYERFKDMLASGEATSDDFLRLREDCRAFEKTRSRFTGAEKAVAADCNAVSSILEELDSKSIFISGDEDTLDVRLRNLPGFTFEVRPEGKDSVVYSREYANPAGSFYRFDTVRVVFPVLDDGHYTVRCVSGEISSVVTYDQESISVAYRADGDGIAVYAADRKSGRPLDGADIRIYRKDSLMYSCKDMSFTGFMPLDAVFPPSGQDGWSTGCTMQCSYRDSAGVLRLSDKEMVAARRYRILQDDNIPRCSIFKDRSVFERGDTLFFKAVLYYGNGNAGVLRSGEPVSVSLNGQDGRKIDSLSLSTNGFGSVSGSFIIPEDGVNGHYFIEVRHDKYTVAADSFVVGDIDIPTYGLTFEPCDTIYFPGDSITVRGVLKSYSGHSLGAARSVWTVSCRDREISGELEPGPDGRFSFGFRDSTGIASSSYYFIKVKVTDATGETLEFDSSVTVSPSFRMEAVLENPADGQFIPPVYDRYSPMTGHGYGVMDGDVARMKFTVLDAGYRQAGSLPVKYSVYHGNELVAAGTELSGSTAVIDLSGRPSGLYRVEAEAGLRMTLPEGDDSLVVFRYLYDLAKVAPDDTALDFDVKNLFKVVSDEDIVLQMGTTRGPLWAVVELWDGTGTRPLESGMVYVEGVPGKPGSLKELRYEFRQEYPDDVRLSVFCFKDGSVCEYSAEYHRQHIDYSMPVSFSSFTAEAGPGEEVSMTVKADPEAEVAVAVFDSATEQIMTNTWYPVQFHSFVPQVNIFSHPGNTGRGFFLSKANTAAGKRLVADFAAPAPAAGDMAVEEAIPFSMASVSAPADQYIRDDFSNTLAFIPFLHPGEDSTATFTFRTSGKVSTYRVAVFAHDRSMRNGVASGDMVVTRPVIVSVVPPRFLHEGDRYVLSASVSNASDMDVSGVLDMYMYECEDYRDSVPVLVCSRPVSVPRGEAVSERFEADVPEGIGAMGFRLAFEGGSASASGPGCTAGRDGSFSDGLFVSVPVTPDVQTLTEAHSAVLLPGMDLDSLKSVLAGEFVNTQSYGAAVRRISLLDMILESIPEKTRETGKDVISLSDALYVRMLCGSLPGREEVDGLVEKIMDCQNADGGFGWFAGMESSAQITALLLERMTDLEDRAHQSILDDGALRSAVSYLDSRILSLYEDSRIPPYTDISLPQYLYVRTMYPSVPLLGGNSGAVGKKALASFRKAVAEYMTAATGSARFDGRLIDKARRASVAMDLMDQGSESLSGFLGLGKGKMRKISRILDADILSLRSYAVSHASGGVYYPNAVMPFRGLTESELYAHALICDLMQRYSETRPDGVSGVRDIADGLRIWMMVQKETQQWEREPAYVHAMASVLDGSPEVLATEIVVLTKSYIIPFSQIGAAGNGFSVRRQFFREAQDAGAEGRPAAGVRSGSLEEITEGDTLFQGDKVICRYTVWSGENRSFVRLTVPRCAAFRPVDQVSGLTGWWARPLAYSPARIPVPMGYREVRDDRTVYSFSTFPEENTVIEEEFYVTQSGIFSSAVPEVESVYAPHYRANGGYDGMVCVE